MTVLAAAAAALVAGCATSSIESESGNRAETAPSMHRSSEGAPPASATWPIPVTGNAVVAAMNRMPRRLGAWERIQVSRGRVFYAHPRGQLGIEGSDLEDLYIEDDLTAEVALERLAFDLDPGTSRSCSRPPYHCVLGELQGHSAMAWGHDDSDVVLVAVWPDARSRDLLAAAWAAAQN